MMYFMSKSFYLNVSWAQSTLYKGIKSFINEETRAKICLTSGPTHDDLKALVHPCQLEKRFGGIVDTPNNFWPPYVGPEFVPQNAPQVGIIMNDEEYKRCLQENPLLFWHPEFMTSPACPSKDFKFTEPDDSIHDVVADVYKSSGSLNLGNNLRVPASGSPGQASSIFSSVRSGLGRAESVYFDAYTGDN
jgi:hypothetical protein